MGFDGFTNIFPSLRGGHRARATVRIGKPYYPFRASRQRRVEREQLEAVGHDIMRHISELIPSERRGHYSADPDIRAAARGTEVYPWANAPED
jgi:hypothetical protein